MSESNRKIVVGVVFGGQSGEHEVSIKSACAIIAAMKHDRYTVVPMGITREGRWIIGVSAFQQLMDAADTAILGSPAIIPDWVMHQEKPAEYSAIGDHRLPPSDILEKIDVLFPALHGTYGEDGTIQGLFEMLHIPYVGCGVLASALAMDKISFKEVMNAHKIPSTSYVSVTRAQFRNRPGQIIELLEEKLGYPVFCKPANLGSSVGISKCTNRETIQNGLALAARYDRRIIVEKAVANSREIEVSVLGNDNPKASCPGEILPSREFYDYSAKYVDDGDNASLLLIPAPLTDHQAEHCRKLAVQAFRVMDGAGMARVDFLMDANSTEIVLNEINTIPGFTSVSMYSKLWEHSGLKYTDLIDQLIELGIQRARDRSDTLYTAFDTSRTA